MSRLNKITNELDDFILEHQKRCSSKFPSSNPWWLAHILITFSPNQLLNVCFWKKIPYLGLIQIKSTSLPHSPWDKSPCKTGIKYGNSGFQLF